MSKRSLLSFFIRLIFKHPKLLIVVALLGGLWYAFESMVLRPQMSYMGVPQIMAAPQQVGISHILRNKGYMLEYSEGLKNPLWVVYQVKQEAAFKPGKRPSQFSADWRSIAGVKHEDYTGSGYDRGHMAPNYAIASRYGNQAQLETFLMTNITPQKPNLNQKSWQRLEELVANDFAKEYGDLWVFTGPIFEGPIETLSSSSVAIPTAFFKIIVRPLSEQAPAQVLAFIFPQTAKPRASLMTFVTTVDEIEAQTGIDFMADFEDNFEAMLESSRAPEAWNLQAVANRPSRY